MNTKLVLTLAATLLLAPPLRAQTPVAATFTAGHGSWFDDVNWSGGLYPGTNTAATVDGAVVWLHARGLATPLVIKSLTLLNEAEADVRDARLQLDDLTASNSTVHVYGSHLLVTRLRVFQPVACLGLTCGGIKLNPSLVEAQEFTLNGTTVTTTFGLGGTNAATADGRGPGHHARVVCAMVRLDGSLALEFLYGFAPQAGQQFEIIHVNTTNGPNSGLTGRFANGREGGAVAVFGDLMLVLTYVGGDGNDVVLTAVPRRTLSLTKVGPGTLALNFPTTRGHFYTVEATTHLAPATWSPLPIVLGDGAMHTTTTTNSGSGKFHRLFGDSDGN
jgi:hypothetical protein